MKFQMKKIINLIAIFTVLLTVFCAHIYASEFITGRVIKVMDGDTIKIVNDKDNQVYKIRFACIDAPESKQKRGEEARDFLSDLINGLDVQVEVLNTDMYGRSVGLVSRNSMDINGIMLRNGYAWHYRQYDHTQNKDLYDSYENAARNEGLGLWQDDNPEEPWKWRRENKK